MISQNQQELGISSRYFNTGIGVIFALAYICTLELVFHLSDLQEHSNEKAQVIAVGVLVSAALNTLSHTAVVAGVLNDTYVVSILIGVGFDVLSTLLYLGMWIELLLVDKGNTSAGDTSSNEQPPTSLSMIAILLGVACLTVTLLQWLTHIRALLLSSSATRLQSVVKSAWNNLRGEPGESYQDHLFAYTDLGYHVFHILAALRLVGWSLRTGLLILGTLTTIVIAIFLGGSSWSTSPPENQLPPGLLRISKEGKPVCSCHVCTGSRVVEEKAFSIDMARFQLCDLWFQSFGQMCHILGDLEQVKS